MSQQGIRKTKRLLDFQARNQLGTPGGRRAFEKGDTFLELCPIVSKYVQHIFPVGTKMFVGETPRSSGCGPMDFYITNNKLFLAYFMRILNSCVVQ